MDQPPQPPQPQSPPQPAPPGDMVVAEILLTPASGQTWAGAGQIDSQTVQGYYPPPNAADQAAHRLTAMGFGVRQDSPLALTIWGRKALFERAFHTELQPQTVSPPPDALAPESGARGVGAEAGAEEVYADQDAPGYWTPASPPVIPRPLQGLVEQVVFPTPMTYFNE